MKIILVFDYAYGANPQADLGDAFWLVASPANRALASAARQSGSTDSNSAVFDPPLGLPAAEDIVERVQDIELHHPEWSVVEVIGVEPTPQSLAAMSEAGYKTASDADCILIRRSEAKEQDGG